MKISLTIALLLTGVVMTAQNLLDNSSFELGTAEWALQRFVGGNPVCRQPEFDPTQKVHGQVSLKIANPEADGIRLFSHEVKLEPEQKYTLSFYAMSDRPIKIRFGVLGGRATAPRGHDPKLTAQTLSTDWKPYRFSFKTKGGFTYYSAYFHWGDLDKIRNNATVRIDAVQLSPDATAKYAPKSETETALILPERVMVQGQAPLTAELRAINYGRQPASRAIDLKLIDSYRGQTVKTWRKSMTLSVGTVVTEKIPLAPEKIGCYRLEGEGLRGRNFAVVGEVPTRPVDPRRDFAGGLDEPLGYIFSESSLTTSQINSYTALGVDLNDYFRFLQNSGIKVLRAGNTGNAFDWRYLEPKEGTFDWTAVDRLVAMAQAHHMTIMPVLGNMPYLRRRDGGLVTSRLPAWLIAKSNIIKSNPLWDTIEFPLADWTRYIRAFVSRYKGRINCWEIFNEPNLIMPADRYLKYLKAAYETIKEVDPNATVVGFCSTGDLDGRMVEFMEQAARQGGLKYCDAVSFHPYSTRSDASTPSAAEGIIRLREVIDRYRPGLPLWNTELYFLSRGEGTDNRAFHLVRRMLTDLGEGAGQSFCLGSNHLLQFELRPQWNGVPVAYFGFDSLIPSEMYVAQNTMARLFEGAQPLRRLKWPQGAVGYLYRDRNGRPLAACWGNLPAIRYTLELPAGIVALDIFGNPLTEKRLTLNDNPVYLRGNGLESWLTKVQPPPDWNCLIAGNAFLIENGRPGLALELRSIVDENTAHRVTLKSISSGKVLPETVEIRLTPRGAAQVFLPFVPTHSNRCDAGKAEVTIDDRTFTLYPATRTIAAVNRNIAVKNRGNVKIGGPDWQGPQDCSFNFTATADSRYFRLKINVIDDKRSGGQEAVWNNDTVELFIDAMPGRELSASGYTPHTCRLFLIPSTNGKPAALTGSKNLKVDGLEWKIADTPTGYTAVLSIPWRNLGLNQPAAIAFAIAVDDNDSDRRKSQMLWGGTVNNHSRRIDFGLLKL